jgi:hypothetical protein
MYIEEFSVLSGTIIGGLIGIVGTLSGTYLHYKIYYKKEITQFYSWVDSILIRFIDNFENSDERKEVAISLRESQLHYYYFKIWPNIPVEDRINDQIVYPRSEIIEFLRSAEPIEKDEIEKIRPLYEKSKKLHDMLQKYVS